MSTISNSTGLLWMLASVSMVAPWPLMSMSTAALGDPAIYDCIIDPSLSLDLGSPITGLLEEVLVERGDWVEKGEPVARLDGRIEKATVALFTERAQSVAEIEGQKARVRLAEQNYERARTLTEQAVGSAQVLEEREATLEVARRELAEAELRKRLNELELQRAQEALAQRTIVSPVSGWVMERRLGAGEYVHQEAKIVSIAQIDPLHVETFVPVEMYPAFSLGMEGTVFPTTPGGSVPARVIVVDHVLDASSGTFGVRLVLDNAGKSLPAGQLCEVTFDLPAD